MQDNAAYNTVQPSNSASSENVYDIPNVSQTDARNVQPVASHINKKRFGVKKCSSLVAVFAIVLAALAVVLSVIQLFDTSNQEQKVLLNGIESNIQNLHKTFNKTIDTLRLEILGLLAKQLPSETEPTATITTLADPSEVCDGPGWRRVAFINMTDPKQNCPQGLSQTGYSIRSCGRGHSGMEDCSSVTFPVDGPQYRQVCGRAIAHQWAQNYAFYSYHTGGQTFNGPYVDGLSLTHGSPRTHIWTFASGLFSGTSGNSHSNLRCPCDPGNTNGSPPFVGNDYFCESVATVDNWSGPFRFFPNNALWDGQDLLNPCFGLNNPPWFNKTLPEPTTEDIEFRMCFTDALSASNIGVNLLEVYVK